MVIPWVNSREEAEKAVKAAKYPPRGIRGFGPRRAALRDKEYTKTADQEIMVIVQIETKSALEQLDEILSVEGVDACFVGPMDLTMSLGILGQLQHPLFEEALLRAVEAAKKQGIIPGIATVPVSGDGCLPELTKLLRMGFRMISLSYDMGFLLEGTSNLLNTAKRLTLDQ